MVEDKGYSVPYKSVSLYRAAADFVNVNLYAYIDEKNITP